MKYELQYATLVGCIAQDLTKFWLVTRPKETDHQNCQIPTLAPHIPSWSKGVTLHSRLYSHPCQDLDPSDFRAWPFDHTENSALTLDYSALATPIEHLERLTVSKLASTVCLTTWPASKFHLDCYTSLDPSCGWEYCRLCSVTPLLVNMDEQLPKISRAILVCKSFIPLVVEGGE